MLNCSMSLSVSLGLERVRRGGGKQAVLMIYVVSEPHRIGLIDESTSQCIPVTCLLLQRLASITSAICYDC